MRSRRSTSSPTSTTTRPTCSPTTTARRPRFWKQTDGKITHFVATMGTTGTLMGCSKRFRELNPKIRVIGVEPYLGHRLQGLKNLKEAYVPGIFDASALDRKVNIEDEAAWDMTRALARKEGLLVGMSAGAAMYVAHETAKQIESGVIVVVFPDGGERYLSTPLFQVKTSEPAARLHFFNSLTRQHESFEPRADAKEVTMYSCGPTVHRRPHLGVLRRMMVDDVVRRALEAAGHKVKHVVSITDVDDLTIRESDKTGVPLKELCQRHEAEFHKDLEALAIKPAHVYCRSSESVDSMIAMTRELMEKGAAYEQYHSVFFNIGRTKGYGDLLGRQGLSTASIAPPAEEERYEGVDPRDFVLFRRCDLAEMRKGLAFKTEWGNVRPSWHVECAAMARAHLGDQFDIHTGSAELDLPAPRERAGADARADRQAAGPLLAPLRARLRRRGQDELRRGDLPHLGRLDGPRLHGARGAPVPAPDALPPAAAPDRRAVPHGARAARGDRRGARGAGLGPGRQAAGQRRPGLDQRGQGDLPQGGLRRPQPVRRSARALRAAGAHGAALQGGPARARGRGRRLPGAQGDGRGPLALADEVLRVERSRTSVFTKAKSGQLK
ncbi:MAG: pyridoxal-phosphate dependent enzyme [Myxococcales bacterium]